MVLVNLSTPQHKCRSLPFDKPKAPSSTEGLKVDAAERVNNTRLLDCGNEAPRSPAPAGRGTLSGIAPKPYPPSLSGATARSSRHSSLQQLQGILAKANEGRIDFVRKLKGAY